LEGAAVDQVFMSFGGIPAEGSSVFPQVVKGQTSRNIAYTEGGANAGKQINALNLGSYTSNAQQQSPKLEYKIEGNMIGGQIVYPDGKINDFLAYRNVTENGGELELTTLVLYPRGAAGNELKNEFGQAAISQTLELFIKDAQTQGFGQLRMQFQRAANSSSAKPGKVVDITFDLNKNKKK